MDDKYLPKGWETTEPNSPARVEMVLRMIGQRLEAIEKRLDLETRNAGKSQTEIQVARLAQSIANEPPPAYQLPFSGLMYRSYDTVRTVLLRVFEEVTKQDDDDTMLLLDSIVLLAHGTPFAADVRVMCQGSGYDDDGDIDYSLKLTPPPSLVPSVPDDDDDDDDPGRSFEYYS